MRIAVRHGAYVDAARSCRDANHGAALIVESTAGKLPSYAATAGDDASSETFAHSYDPAARVALDTMCRLTDALAGTGRAIAASGRNHAHAEHASAGLRTEPYAGPRDDSFRTLPCFNSPSVLGGDSPYLDPVSTWIIDQVQGFMWPGADVTALRELASPWRTTGMSIDCLTGNLDTAANHLAMQHSPEIPHALDTLADLRRLLRNVNDELHDLAASCDDYATAVEDARQRTKDLLAELLVMLGEEALITVGITFITAGWGTGPKGVAAAARVTAFAHRFHSISAVLRTSAHACATKARAVEKQLAHLQHKLDNYLGVPLRGERGAMLLPGGWKTTLKAQDDLGGHPFSRHVGKDVDALHERAQELKRQRPDHDVLATSFDDLDSAEAAIEDVLTSDSTTVQAWLDGEGARILVLHGRMEPASGLAVDASGHATRVSGIRVVLKRDPNAEAGYRVHTAFPEP